MQNIKILKDTLNEKGYVLVKNLFSDQESQKVKNIIRDYFNVNKKDDNTGVLPDAFYYLPKLSDIFQKKELVEIIQAICDNDAHYTHHSDIHFNKTAGFHRDSIYNKRNYMYAFSKKNVFKDQDYAIYKIAWYFQDYSSTKNNDGLTVIPFSHIDENAVPENEIKLETKPNDIIIFDTRILHKGIASITEKKQSVDRLSMFFTFGKNTQATLEFSEGTIWRQNRQLKRKIYELPHFLEKKLKDANLSIINYKKKPKPTFLDFYKAELKNLASKGVPKTIKQTLKSLKKAYINFSV